MNLINEGGDADFRDWSICEEDEVMPFGTCEDKI